MHRDDHKSCMDARHIDNLPNDARGAGHLNRNTDKPPIREKHTREL